LLAELKTRGNYFFSVNATTRAPREDEVEGVDYYFVTKEQFQRMLDAGELLEHATVYGQEKGVPRAPIRDALSSGRDVLMRTDIQGARTIKQLVPGAVTIFLAPPSTAELRRRVRQRGGDSAEQVKVREMTSVQEIATSGEFDYQVVNDDLTTAADEIERIIARERNKRGRPDTSV
jgi:guanylate kinase